MADLIETLFYFFPDIQENYITLLMFTFSISIYALLIYSFYHLVARRDVFGFDVEQYKRAEHEGFFSKVFNFSLGVVKYGLIYPVIVFLWFAAFSTMLFAFSQDQPLADLLLISIVIVSAIRVTAYVREDLARDLAKLLPLALLATFLTDPNFFSFGLINERLEMMVDFIPHIIQFVSFSILLEWILRILFFFRVRIFGLPDKMLHGKEEED